MRVRSIPRSSQSVSKRKNEAGSSSTRPSEPCPKRMSRTKESGPKVDKYCWLCHTLTDEKICVTCHRAFHSSCLNKKSASFSELGVCPECLSKSVDGTELSANKFFNSEKLKKMLDKITRTWFEKNPEKNKPSSSKARCSTLSSSVVEIFSKWPEEHRDKLLKIIDKEILLDLINNFLPYTKTAEFYSDVKCIHHNSCIAYGVDSVQAKAAGYLIRDFKEELLLLEACPECYYLSNCDTGWYDPFVRLCDPPHDIVWAKLFKQTYWPAKCLKVVKGKAHVRFFGKHEWSNIPIQNCYYLSKTHPNDENSDIESPANSGCKTQAFQAARAELLRYIYLYKRKFGDFRYSKHKTPYKTQEKQNEVVIISAKGSSNRNIVQMKLEGQYTTPDELLSNVQVDPTFLTAEPIESGLNNNISPVTSINMSFSSDENLLNPVVTSIESLQPTESPVAFSALGVNSLDCDFIKGILNSATSKVSETVNCTETLSTTVASNGLNDSSVQPDSLQNIMNNFSVLAGNQAELDSEVQCIGRKWNTEEDEPINPDMIVSLLEEDSPELKEIFKKARYSINGILLSLWANCNENPHILRRISKMCVDLRKCKSDLKKVKEENDKFKMAEADYKDKIQSLMDQLKKSVAENLQATENAKLIINSLRSGCSKRIEAMLKNQFMNTIEEKEKKLVDAERTIKCLEEEKGKLEKEVEDAKVFKQSTEQELRKSVYNRDDISIMKKKHFCCICEGSAAVTCCLNTSYCSERCQKKHAEEHLPFCTKEISQIVQQTVQKTVVISVERSTTNNSNTEMPNIDPKACSSNSKNASKSASAMLSTSDGRVVPTPSCSSTSKTKKDSRAR